MISQYCSKPVLLLIGWISASLFTASANSAELPRSTTVPGGVAVIELGAGTEKTPEAWYRGNRLLVARKSGRWYAIVGIPLSARPGSHQITLKGAGERNISFDVTGKKYREQHLTISNKRMVNPDADDLRRIRRETEEIAAAFSRWRDVRQIDTRFAKPVDGILSSPFGLRRFFNGQPRKPHSGLDIAAPEGTPIRSPAAGVVAATGDFFFNGNTVFIDHGQGLITMYCHMERIDVKKDDLLAKGDIIGTVGMTGRVTGAHLHWSVSLNNTRVDPELFMADSTP